MTAPAESVRMMVDTGADLSVLDNEVFGRLGFQSRSRVKITGVSQKLEIHPLYRASISLPVEHPTQPGARLEVDLSIAGTRRPKHYDGILGRDFLRHFRLVYDGHDGFFELELRSKLS